MVASNVTFVTDITTLVTNIVTLVTNNIICHYRLLYH